MDAFEELEQQLYKDGVTVHRDKLPKCIGYYTSLFDFIYLNVDRDLRGAKALSVLSHEIGHHSTGLVGDSSKNERRADRWAAERLLKPSDIVVALQNGCSNFYELSRELNVDERFMRRCFSILSETYGGFVQTGDYTLFFNPLYVLQRTTGERWPEERL